MLGLAAAATGTGADSGRGSGSEDDEQLGRKLGYNARSTPNTSSHTPSASTAADDPPRKDLEENSRGDLGTEDAAAAVVKAGNISPEGLKDLIQALKNFTKDIKQLTTKELVTNLIHLLVHQLSTLSNINARFRSGQSTTAANKKLLNEKLKQQEQHGAELREDVEHLRDGLATTVEELQEVNKRVIHLESNRSTSVHKAELEALGRQIGTLQELFLGVQQRLQSLEQRSPAAQLPPPARPSATPGPTTPAEQPTGAVSSRPPANQGRPSSSSKKERSPAPVIAKPKYPPAKPLAARLGSKVVDLSKDSHHGSARDIPAEASSSKRSKTSETTKAPRGRSPQRDKVADRQRRSRSRSDHRRRDKSGDHQRRSRSLSPSRKKEDRSHNSYSRDKGAGSQRPPSFNRSQH